VAETKKVKNANAEHRWKQERAKAKRKIEKGNGNEALFYLFGRN
jgi:hypothetical protein